MINGLSHITFIVRDLNKMKTFSQSLGMDGKYMTAGRKYFPIQKSGSLMWDVFGSP